MELTAKNVETIFFDCMFKQEELADLAAGEAPKNAIIVDGLMGKFGFHPDRVATHMTNINEMLSQLPIEFMSPEREEGGGGGMSFLNACMTRTDEQWGEHRNMDQLFAIGQAAGLAKYQLPREMWSTLPGGMPYVVVEKETPLEELAKGEEL